MKTPELNKSMYHPTEQCRQIIKAALAKDSSLLPPNVPIDICCSITLINNQGQYTSLMCAASYLAYLGNRDGSQWLQHHGASIHSIARGAAQGGHRDYAKELRAHGASIETIARGAAQGGHKKYAEELRAKGASIHPIAHGTARGGHRDYAEELRAKGADIYSIAGGAAEGGHLYSQHSWLVWVVTICKDDEEVSSFIEDANINQDIWQMSDEIKDKIRAQACGPIRLKQRLFPHPLFRQHQDSMYALSLPSLAMSEDRAPYADVNLLRSIGPPDELRKFLDGVCRTTLFCQMAISSREVTEKAIALPNMPDELYQKILEGMLWLHIGEYSVQYQEAFSQMSLNEIFTLVPSLFHRVTKFLNDNKLPSKYLTTSHHQVPGTFTEGL